MTIVSAHKCDIGQVRKQNEDYVWVDDQAGIYILADGMGGREGGKEASQLAATTVGRLVKEQLPALSPSSATEGVQELVINAIETANEIVFEAGQKAGHKRGMKTTIVTALIRSSTAYISHVGDSRAYLVQGLNLTQLTEDNSWRVEFGGPEQTKENGRTKIDHMLTKSIGQEAKVEPSFRELKLTSGDCLLLCSDGLWDMVGGERIAAELKRAENDPEQAVEALVDAANAAGGKDNIAVVVIKLV